MDPFDIILAALGVTILGLGLASRVLSRGPIPPSLLALGIGILLGPAGLGSIEIASLGSEPEIREHLSRLALGIGLMGVALRVPKQYPRAEWRTLAVLLGPGMLLMWIVGTGLVLLLTGLPLWLSALIGAILTPTDPIAASPIVTGELAERNLPGRVRHVISFDSGANDGLAFLLFFLSVHMLTLPVPDALRTWATKTLLWEVLGATAIGFALGYVAALLLRWAEERGTIESDWRLVYTVALALLTLGLGRLLASDELLVVFGAGVAFVQVVSEEDREEEDRGQEAVNRFFALPMFALLGLTIPWQGWLELGWRGPALVAGVLLLRRPPALLLLSPWLPDLPRRADALFVGWFGPIAVAAIYYASLAEVRLAEPVVWHVVSLVITGSVVAHGLTGAPLTRLYGTRTGERSRIEAERTRAEKRESD